MGLGVMDTFTDFPDPIEGHTIGGTFLDDGTPVYFHVPEDTPDLTIAGMAFEARHGHAPSDADWAALAIIERHRGAVQL